MNAPVLFVLPVKGGSGGAHSVMQEAEAMWRLGQPAVIAANSQNAMCLRGAYADLPRVSEHIEGFDGGAGLRDLIQRIEPAIAVATTNQSVHTLGEAVKGSPDVRTAYYIQDYEPFFYAAGSDDWRVAHASYGLIPDMVHFAKTRWLQEVVQLNHDISVAKVSPSIDHDVYYPAIGGRTGGGGAVFHVVTMLRPATPRRAPYRTVRILNAMADRFGGKIKLSVFGCRAEEVAEHQLKLHPDIEVLGVLGRTAIGDLFRQTDLFMDLSDFQAFGRTAIEAMSCGAICIVPAHGGVHEYGVDGQNCFIVDTRYDAHIMAAVNSVLAMGPDDRRRVRMNGIARGYDYSVEKAALSELNVLM